MLKVNKTYFEAMVAGYLECAAWSTSDDGDDNFEGYEYSNDAIKDAEKDCLAFYLEAGDLFEGLDPDQVGHDFWLTREGHGAGFWDRGLGEVGDRLTDIAKSFGSGDLYKGDDDLLYFLG